MSILNTNREYYVVDICREAPSHIRGKPWDGEYWCKQKKKNATKPKNQHNYETLEQAFPIVLPNYPTPETIIKKLLENINLSDSLRNDLTGHCPKARSWWKNIFNETQEDIGFTFNQRFEIYKLNQSVN